MLKNRMLKYLPFYEQKSEIFHELMKVQGKELDQITLDLKDLERQLFIETATWTLDIYEKELGIQTDRDKTYEDRRSTIKSKWRGTGKVDRNLIKLVADAYTNGDVEVTFDGRINIIFTSVYGVPPNIEDLKNAIEEIKPAHLEILYEFLYITWLQMRQTTWGKVKKMNWKEVRTRKVIGCQS
ncbi:putative phage tail protein [Inediibacterium massiliense]|uniref:putative phage tail protein n=1 Tax=Inediibacterium massiliense TaxID=1658111 RepID=UPI000ADAFFEA|nr:putative phage tail protein [Inediibacterium massiliense]